MDSNLLTELAAVAFFFYAFSLGGVPVLVWRHAGAGWGVFFSLLAAAYWVVSWLWPHQSVRAAQLGVPLEEGDSIRFILGTFLLAGGLGLLVFTWKR